jgi:hypothetical protein
MNNAKTEAAGAGLQTAALVFGGDPGAQKTTELYNGTSWTAGGNLNTGRRLLGGAGTQTSALAFGGLESPTATEEFTGGPVNVNKTISFS